MPWWGWVLLSAGVLGLVAFAFREQLQYLVRVAKALTTDERLPRPLRWALALVLAIRVPLVRQIIQLVVGLLLVTVYRPYRPTVRAILDESRRATPN